jgi:hypothetical protein
VTTATAAPSAFTQSAGKDGYGVVSGHLFSQPSQTECALAYSAVRILSPPSNLGCDNATHRKFKLLESDSYRLGGDDGEIRCEQP